MLIERATFEDGGSLVAVAVFYLLIPFRFLMESSPSIIIS